MSFLSKENDEITKEPRNCQRTRTAPPLEIPHKNTNKTFVLRKKDGMAINLAELGNEEAKIKEDENKDDEIAHTNIEDTNSSTTKATCGSSESNHLLEDESTAFFAKKYDLTISEYKKFLQIEILLKDFPYVPEIDFATKVNNLLAIKERTMVPFKLSLPKKAPTSSLEVYSNNLKKRDVTCIEKIRAEFNRVTESNVNEVINKIRGITVSTIDEMKAITAFIFEKTITEKLYLSLYIGIIKELKKDWTCQEEMKMGKKTTCFHSMLHVYMNEKIKMVQNWNKETDLASIKAADNVEFEEKLEDIESKRLAKKRQSIGTIQLMTSLYNQGADGASFVVEAINELLQKTSTEHVEMLCELIKQSGARLYSLNHEDSVKAVYEYLYQKQNINDLRIKCIVKETLDGMGKYYKISKGGPRTENKYAFFSNENVEPEAEDTEELDDQELSNFILKLAAKIEANEDEALREIQELFARHSPESFFTEFFNELLTNHKRFELLRQFFEKKLVKLVPDYKAMLVKLKDSVNFLAMDCPVANRLYAEFLIYNRAAELITAEEFKQLQRPEFSKHSMQLVNKWKEDKDNRMSVVFSMDNK